MDIDVENFFENLDFENMAYFFHITGAGNGSGIIKDGLYLADNKIWSTANELTPDLLTNINLFIKNRGNQVVSKNDEMVIIGCLKEELPYILQKIDTFYGNPYQYVIPSEYIIGYIDIKGKDSNYSIILNPMLADLYTSDGLMF